MKLYTKGGAIYWVTHMGSLKEKKKKVLPFEVLSLKDKPKMISRRYLPRASSIQSLASSLFILINSLH